VELNMQTHDTTTSPRPVVPRPAPHDAAVLAKIETLAAQVAYLVERQKKQEELLAEMMPIAKEVLATATTRLGDLEQRGYFAFGREAVRVAERVVEGFTPEDVRAFGDAVVSILETVRAVTQPEVLATIAETGKVLEAADRVQPLGLVGMVRATGNDDVQKGMAVMLEVLRHMGRAAQSFADKRAASPTEQRRQRLAETLGPRRKKALGVERAPAAPRAAAARPAPAVAIGGVLFGPDGHLADPKTWTPELAAQIAAAEGVAINEDRFRVIVAARTDFEANGMSPNIRRLTGLTSLATKDLYALFPKAPARTIAKIAGIPKPAGCL